MKPIHLGLAALAAALVAGCGGGSDTREIELQEKVEELEDKVIELEKRPTDDDLRRAEELAEDKGRREAENDSDQEIEEANRKAEEAENKVREQEEVIGKSTAQIKRDEAYRIRRGIEDNPDAGPGSDSLAVTPVYGKPAQLTVPGINRGNLGSPLQEWRMTSFLNDSTSTMTDTVEIYTNIKSDDRINWDSASEHIPDYGELATHFTQGRTNWSRGGGVAIGSNNQQYAKLPNFPSNTNGAQVQILVDRRADRDQNRYPDQWSIELSGTLRGANGHFRCEATTQVNNCTITDTGDTFAFSSSPRWRFFPSDPKTQVHVADARYMWFGWWSRKTEETTSAPESVTSHAHYGGMGAQTDFSDATGTARYVGPVVGQYAIVDDLGEDSDSGRFTATVTLDADFDATTNTLSGTVNRFSNDSTWEVNLRSAGISSGAISGGPVSWSIGEDSVRKDGGQWSAAFYSEIASPPANSRPTGVAGAFTAHHGDDRRMTGAFGAERTN